MGVQTVSMSWAMKIDPQNQIRVRDVLDILQFISHYQFRVFSVLKSVEEKEVLADFKTTTNSKTRRALSQKRTIAYLEYSLLK